MRKRSDIASDIERENAKLAPLHRQINETSARLAGLHAELSSLPQEQSIVADAPPVAYMLT